MAKLIIESFQEFEKYVGMELGISDYITITQEQINQFANATHDHQWIHTDPARAATESPFKSTIAHGYLTLSVVPHLWQQITEIKNLKMEINYGIDKLKFSEPVLSGDQVRLKATLNSLLNLRGIAKAQLDVVLEIKDKPKSAFNGTLTFLYHFK